MSDNKVIKREIIKEEIREFDVSHFIPSSNNKAYFMIDRYQNYSLSKTSQQDNIEIINFHNAEIDYLNSIVKYVAEISLDSSMARYFFRDPNYYVPMIEGFNLGFLTTCRFYLYNFDGRKLYKNNICSPVIDAKFIQRWASSAMIGFTVKYEVGFLAGEPYDRDDRKDYEFLKSLKKKKGPITRYDLMELD